MKLHSVSVERFRNLQRHQGLALSPRATVVVGENGQGKTNLLEALYFLCTLKALRANRLSELISFGGVSARVQGDFEIAGATRTIAVEIEAKKRTALVDGKKAATLEAYFGGVSVVAFTPDDLAIVKGAPETRRQFVDRAVFNRFPGYLAESREYLRALKNRNQLLKTRSAGHDIEVWDDVLAKCGARIWVRRRALLRELGPKVTAAFARIARIQAQGTFVLKPSLADVALETSDEAQLERTLREALTAKLSVDRERGFTSVGPHSDELKIELGAHKAKAFASQGQARALVLAWKIAEIENLQASNGFLPLLLLDDVSSELDPERNAYLMHYLQESGAQTLLTTTDVALVKQAVGTDAVYYQVKDGRIATATSIES